MPTSSVIQQWYRVDLDFSELFPERHFRHAIFFVKERPRYSHPSISFLLARQISEGREYQIVHDSRW